MIVVKRDREEEDYWSPEEENLKRFKMNSRSQDSLENEDLNET